MKSGFVGAVARLIVVIAIAWFVAIGPNMGFGPAELAAQYSYCTVRDRECGSPEGHSCPSCSYLCAEDCPGYTWDGELPDPNCMPGGPANCDPWCDLEEEACYINECGCIPPIPPAN